MIGHQKPAGVNPLRAQPSRATCASGGSGPPSGSWAGGFAQTRSGRGGSAVASPCPGLAPPHTRTSTAAVQHPFPFPLAHGARQ